MELTEMQVREVSKNISNYLYRDNLTETRELIELFNAIARHKLETPADYVKMYDDSFYTYTTFRELVESEKEQTEGLTEEECLDQLNLTIWKLPCGWYVQYV